MSYVDKSDNELVSMINAGDTSAISVLIERYKGAVKSASRSLFLFGGDNEDLIQEGTIGLLKAVSTFNGKSPFRNYAYLCIKSQILTAIKQGNAKKNLPLNNYISLTGFDDDSENNEITVSSFDSPETDYINRESVEELKISISGVLSKFENEVLAMYLSGSTFAEICSHFDKNQKSIDNALHRIRKKISKTVNLQGRV